MKKDREAYNAYMADYLKRRYHARRAELITKLGGRCEHCGATECLELDHRNQSEKAFDVSKSWSRAQATLGPELAKCRLLCSDCHRVKTTLERGQTPARGTHGTISAYRYCRCDECRAAKAAVHRAWLERKKAA